MPNPKLEQNTIRATYRIVTPMFCGGAEQQAEFRLASFKGVLRFWWRALMWGRAKDCRDLCVQEAALFGASNESIGQSKVRLRIVDQCLAASVEVDQVFEGGRLGGAHYLGYGVMHAFASATKKKKAGQLTRSMIPSGTFGVECLLSPRLSLDQRESVMNALILVGTVGGLGSKSRKGYGSLTLTQLMIGGQTRSLPIGPADQLTGLVNNRHPGLPEWTAWSRDSRVVTVSAKGASAVQVLDMLGREQVFFRSWGRQGRVLDGDSERNFTPDHDLSKGQPVGIDYPKRVVFGLPHNYGGGQDVGPASKKLNRRASPLFLHVHQTADDSPVTGVLTFLPARFLPQGEQIRAFNRDCSFKESEPFWEPIHGYLDRLVGISSATKKKTELEGQEVPL